MTFNKVTSFVMLFFSCYLKKKLLEISQNDNLLYEIDTQDFIFAGKHLLVIHHTAFKVKNRKNLEIFNLDLKKIMSKKVFNIYQMMNI